MSYRVLVLEDDTELRETLAELLEEEGYQVVAVGRGEEAVRQAASQPFDLIVSDIRMDGMDGLEAIDRSRKLQPGLGSLVVSGQRAMDRLAERIGLSLQEERDYATVAGHVLWRLKHLPEVGEHFTDQGWVFEVVDMDGRKIDKLLVAPQRG